MFRYVASFTRRPGRDYEPFCDVVFQLSLRFVHTDESEYRFYSWHTPELVEELLLSAIDANDELRLYTITSARTRNADPTRHVGAQGNQSLRNQANVVLRKR